MDYKTDHHAKMSDHIVVVGAGPAAHGAIRRLVKERFSGHVTLVSAERHLPYDRTLVSKDYLLDPATPVAMEDESFYSAGVARLLRGVRATGVDPGRRIVRLHDGRSLSYDHLLVATGGRATLPRSLQGHPLITLRTRDDADSVRRSLADASSVLVLGGGFIGGELASVASAMGKQVTMVEADAELLGTTFGAPVGERIRAIHEHHGVTVLTGAAVTDVRHQMGRCEATLADKRTLRADLAVAGLGMAPEVEWLVGSGLRLRDGVVTDAHGRTNVPRIYAAGDCAQWWFPDAEEHRRAEHWDTALRQGAAVADVILGRPCAPQPPRYFWSDQHGVKLQWVGTTFAFDELDLKDGDHPTRFVARFMRGGSLAAVLTANDPRALVEARRELQEQSPAQSPSTPSLPISETHATTHHR